jgi:AcrR family transcriptional regulator
MSCDKIGHMTAPSRPGGRPGGRSARVKEAVLSATLEELLVHGYDALSYERIAQQAGVHKTTVYRRWPTKAALVMAVVAQLGERRVGVPDTGSFEQDLSGFARAIVANLGTPEAASVARLLVIAADSSPDLAAEATSWWHGRFGLAAVMVERAIERGEIPDGTDPTAVIETLIGPLYVRLLFTHEPLDRKVADRAAAMTAAATRDGAAM